MAKSPDEEIKNLKMALDSIYKFQSENSAKLDDRSKERQIVQKKIENLNKTIKDQKSKLITFAEEDQIKQNSEKDLLDWNKALEHVNDMINQLIHNRSFLESRAESQEAKYKVLTGKYYKKPEEKTEQSLEAKHPVNEEVQVEQSHEATPDKKSFPSEITDTTAIQVFIPLDQEKQSFVVSGLLAKADPEKLKEFHGATDYIKHLLSDAKAVEQQDLHGIVNLALKEALENGFMQKIEPSISKDDPSSCSYEHAGSKLNQKERKDGKFEFAPTESFSGILRVERQDEKGNLIKDSADIVEYKDGKPIAVIPAIEGITRIANFGAIAREAGVEVTTSKEIADDGIKVAALDPDKFISKHPAKSSEALKPPATPSRDQDKGGHCRE